MLNAKSIKAKAKAKADAIAQAELHAASVAPVAADTATDTLPAIAASATDTAPATDAPATAPVQAAPAELSPRQAAIKTHNESGFFGTVYTGISKTRNGAIAKAPNLATSKATPRTDAQLTDRMRATLTELSARYGAESFPLIGIDRGQAAIFLASGNFIAVSDTRAILCNDTLARYAKRNG